MKVIHLILGKANPDRMNGVNKLVFEMLSTQYRLGFEVTLWGITKNPVHDYPERNFKTVLFQMISNKLSIHNDIKMAIQSLPNDAVFHLHGSFIPEFYHIVNLLNEQNVPYVYTPHGALAPAALRISSWKKSIYFKLFEKQLVQNAACIIATGDSVFENVSLLSRIRRRRLIPNGQPLLTRIDFPKPNDKMIFGFCGRIALEHKGLDLLLEGYKLFKDKGGQAELHLIGDGAEMPKFKALAQNLDILNDLTLYGAQFGADKIKLLSKFDVFVHTSRMEGFPAAVLEATAIGLPVMISRHTNVWDYISKHQCGFLVDPNTPEMIAAKMLEFEKLFHQGKIKKMGENARQMISQNFDWKAICLKLYEEYTHANSTNMIMVKT